MKTSQTKKTFLKRAAIVLYDKVFVFMAYAVLCGLYKIKPFKVVVLVSSRIGHLLGSTEIYLRLQRQNADDHRMTIFVGGRPCNQYFVKMIRRKYMVITNVLFRRMFFVEPIKSKFAKSKRIDFHTLHDRVLINGMEPTFSFNQDEDRQGKKLIADLCGNKKWYVCLHARDSSFLQKQQFHKGDFSYHSYRDCNVENYYAAAEYCAKQGGAVIKMGEISDGEKTYPDYIVDYARNHRSEFGDLYLPAHAKFFLGNTSGLLNASSIFNVPVAAANFTPFDAALRGEKDLFIPKKIWSNAEGRLLTFKEIVDHGFHKFVTAQEYDKNDLVTVENTDDEILGLAMEINQRLDGEWVETEEDKVLQEKYKSLFSPNDGAYKFKSRIGAYFLRANKHLLENATAPVQ